MTLRLRKLSAEDLPLVRSWRNHPDIRRHMYERHEILEAEHFEWFRRINGNPGLHAFVVEDDVMPQGFVSFKEVLPRVAEWGFYAGPQALPGIGRSLGALALGHAFRELELHKVCGQVLSENTRSARLHSLLGFTKEGLLREQYFDGVDYLDVICFGLLAKDWPSPTEDLGP